MADAGLLMPNQRGGVQSDAFQGGDQILAPHALVLRADHESDQHAHCAAGGHRHQHAGDRMPRQHHHHRSDGIQDIPAPFDRGAGAAWPGGGQEGRHAGVDVGQQPGAV